MRKWHETSLLLYCVLWAVSVVIIRKPPLQKPPPCFGAIWDSSEIFFDWISSFPWEIIIFDWKIAQKRCANTTHFRLRRQKAQNKVFMYISYINRSKSAPKALKILRVLYQNRIKPPLFWGGWKQGGVILIITTDPRTSPRHGGLIFKPNQ